MKKTIWAVALAGALGCGPEGPPGMRGDKGDKGDKGDPGGTEASLASIQPTAAFLGRRVTVQIGGNNTHFGQGTKVDFGDPAIKVERITVGSPTFLTAQIFIGPQDPTKATGWAKVQPHDITVTSDHEGHDEVVTLKGQFDVAAPVRFVALNAEDKPGGKLVQGGIGRFVVTNLDYVQNPFAASSRVGLSFLNDGGAMPMAGSGSQVQGRAFLNVKAAPNPLFVAVSPSPLGEVVTYPLPAGAATVSPAVEKRDPTDLVLGMPKEGKLMAKDDTSLYKVPTALLMKDRVYMLNFTKAMTARIRPVVALLPDSGAWDDQLQLGGGASLASAAGTPYFSVVGKDVKDLYAVVYDAQLAGGEGYEYSLTVREREASVVEMYMAGTKPEMPNTQIDLSKATFIKSSKLATHTEKNYFEFKAMKDEKVYVVTAAANAADKTDNTLDVLDGTCKTGTSLTGGPVDDDYFDSVAFDAKAGKTYCVVVADSNFPFYAQMGGPYTLLVTTNP